jgi:hypothetical protein
LHEVLVQAAEVLVDEAAARCGCAGSFVGERCDLGSCVLLASGERGDSIVGVGGVEFGVEFAQVAWFGCVGGHGAEFVE